MIAIPSIMRTPARLGNRQATECQAALRRGWPHGFGSSRAGPSFHFIRAMKPASSWDEMVPAASGDHMSQAMRFQGITGALLAIAPVIGFGRMVGAASGVAGAFGYDIEAVLEYPDGY
jgi:hypothetical protein